MKFQAEYLNGQKVVIEAATLDEAYEIAEKDTASILLAVYPESMTYQEFVASRQNDI